MRAFLTKAKSERLYDNHGKCYRMKFGTHFVLAKSPRLAARYTVAKFAEHRLVPKGRKMWIAVCEYVNDGTPGLKQAANTDGDRLYEARYDGNKWRVHYSEYSFA
jgi:hypothetical protein